MNEEWQNILNISVSKNYHVYKSTPYGPIVKVLPYLARRASENRSVMMGAREERDMLWKELKMRFKMWHDYIFRQITCSNTKSSFKHLLQFTYESGVKKYARIWK